MLSEQHMIYRLIAGRPKLTWKKLTEQGFPFKKIFRGHCDPQVVDFGGHFQFERVTY